MKWYFTHSGTRSSFFFKKHNCVRKNACIKSIIVKYLYPTKCMSHIHSFTLSERGLRESNEDAFCAERIEGMEVFAVAGGKTGRPGGRVAGDIALDSLRNAVRKYHKDPVMALEKAVLDADARIAAIAQKDKGMAGIGTDICACLVNDDLDCTILDTGNGGVYYISPGAGIMLPREIPFSGKKPATGKKMAEQSSHPRIISHTLGEPLVIRGSEFSRMNLLNSFIILSSGGLHDFIKKENIRAIIERNGENVETSCEELKDAAMLAGSDRTITMAIIHGHTD
jgi:serine/threonine protein phosphatase PrpC